MIFQTVQVLVSLAAVVALVWLLFLHSKSSGVGGRGFWIDNREGTVCVVLQSLIIVTMLQAISFATEYEDLGCLTDL